MSHADDVPPAVLLPRLASELKDRKAVAPPDWATFAKTGVHKQQAPTQSDWWYLRSASVLRKVNRLGPLGVARLAGEYGGKKDRGSAPYHARKGSGSTVREILQQLQKAGLVAPHRSQGRRVTPEGRRLLDRIARDALKGLAEQRPELAKYL